MALAQCTRFFRAHPDILPTAVYDTAGAAKEVAEGGDRASAAVAGGRAALRFGLDILAEDLQDRDDNQTRFFVVAKAGTALRCAGKLDRKAVLIAETPNRPGALLALLEPFASAGVNLTKLESRPGSEPWTYRFFLELDASVGGETVESAVARARKCARSLVMLGIF
jgi:prephenate dehydratase